MGTYCRRAEYFICRIDVTPGYGDSVPRYARGVDYSPKQVAELLEQGDVQLIDVRTTAEVDAGRIAGGRHIELTALQSEVDSIDRDRPVIFYCRSGGRSAMATQVFAGAGFDAHNMSGGLLEWVADELPLDPPDGHVAEH